MPAQFTVRRRQLIQSFAGGLRVDLDLRLSRCELAQRSRYRDSDRHDYLPHSLSNGRGSDTISSALKRDRSGSISHDRKSAARPFSTAITMYEYVGQACSRSYCDGTATSSGCE